MTVAIVKEKGSTPVVLQMLTNKLADVLGVNSQTTISDNRNNLVFSYQLYKYFRQDVDWIYREMMERIKPGD